MDMPESRIGSRPDYLGPYLGPGRGFGAQPAVSAAAAKRPAASSMTADAVASNSILQTATLTLSRSCRPPDLGWMASGDEERPANESPV